MPSAVNVLGSNCVLPASYIFAVNKRIEVYISNDPIVALSEFKPNFYDLHLVDINMPHMNGFELCEKILAIDINVTVCFMSSVCLKNIRMKIRFCVQNSSCGSQNKSATLCRRISWFSLGSPSSRVLLHKSRMNLNIWTCQYNKLRTAIRHQHKHLQLNRRNRLANMM